MYNNFKKINGDHPWRAIGPDGYVDYQAFHKENGKIIFFNYNLAKEMGLIARNHPKKMNSKLEKSILDCFSLQILNEHDIWSGVDKTKLKLKPRPYMATRYLQLQHKSRQGKTSGDGRSIWNGYIKNAKGFYFDVSSRGTGATILSPGAQDTNDFVKTGDESLGYSSGTADLDEMLSGALLSEIFFRRKIPTERTLAVINYPDDSAIGVRCAPNLIRPAHIFRLLKMERHSELKLAVDYFLNRQIQNGFLKRYGDLKEQYQHGLTYIAQTYGKLSALLEEEYIFSWLAWDGDNLLASGEILDYGSIRQFAAKHSQYRYEDVDRFSTCLNEQKNQAKLLVQVFAQAMDYALSKEKKNLDEFSQSDSLEVFEVYYLRNKDELLLKKMGFDSKQRKILMEKHRSEIWNFREVWLFFEDLKTVKGEEKLLDGVTVPPVFIMRNLLRELPKFFLQQNGPKYQYLDSKTFQNLMAASYAHPKDLELNPSRVKRIENFQQMYLDLARCCGDSLRKTLKTLAARSEVINMEHRVTGDGLVWITQAALSHRQAMKFDDLQEIMDAFIESQTLLPKKYTPLESQIKPKSSTKAKLLQKIKETLELYKETI